MDIGSYLRKVRTKSNLSIEKLAEHTKIRRENIVAIENNEAITHIPNAYYRGYIKCYCLFFGLNSDEILEHLPAEEYEIPKSSYSPVNTFQVKRSGEPREEHNTTPRSNRNKWLSVAVLSTIFCFTGYQQYLRTQATDTPSISTAVADKSEQIGSIIDIS